MAHCDLTKVKKKRIERLEKRRPQGEEEEWRKKSSEDGK